ncbi:hypothetical protein D8S78_05335 [Natrialba swarupiae]|nr:hypothetical protein [Natrialba swarupiae]
MLDLFTEPEPAQAQCTIWLSDEPVPGTEVTATVHYEDEELADAPVWFNDRHVGQTDEQGQVTGTVPYERELLIRVGAGEDGECRAGQTTASRSPTVTDVDVPHPIVSSTPDTTSSVDDVSSVDFGSLHTADTARAQIGERDGRVRDRRLRDARSSGRSVSRRGGHRRGQHPGSADAVGRRRRRRRVDRRNRRRRNGRPDDPGRRLRPTLAYRRPRRVRTDGDASYPPARGAVRRRWDRADPRQR